MPLVGETEFSYNGLTFGGTTKWNEVVIDPPLLPDAKVEVIFKPSADGAWVYSHWVSDIAFTISGKYAGTAPFTDMYVTWANAFAPRTSDLPLYFRLPGIGGQSIMCRPIKRHFVLDRDLAHGYSEWTVLMESGDPTISTVT